MTVELGDILAWKDWEGRKSECVDFDLDEFFLIVDIDSCDAEPYLALNLNNGQYERFSGRGFSDKQYWEVVA